MHKFRILLLLGLLPYFTVANADIYHTTDSSGNPVFSDRPSTGAKRVNVQQAQTFQALPVKQTPTTAEELKIDNKPDYSRIQIVSPQPGESFFDSSAPLVVKLDDVKLASNHKLVLSIDTPDNHITEPSAATSYIINDIPRGTHQLFVSVVDDKGNEIYRTDGIMFYNKFPSINQPLRLQNIKPKK